MTLAMVEASMLCWADSIVLQDYFLTYLLEAERRINPMTIRLFGV